MPLARFGLTVSRRIIDSPPISARSTKLRIALHMKKTSLGKISWLASITAVLALPLVGQAQTDNFDSGVLDPAWLKSEFSPALTSYTFVNSGSGKAIRLQANPAPPSAPAVASLYRTNVYTDFYMAVDIVEWGGTTKNQAVVLLGRFDVQSNPAAGSGMILNYDTSQYGENPTDRRQGQIQINTVAPGFATSTKAVGEFTLEVGRPYRLVFKGVGTHFTAQAYDSADLTKPLVTLEVDDSTYASGKCGLLAFSRAGVTGTVDQTYDNYYVAATDPNSAIAPATSASIAGTPQVITRTPTNRFSNFYPAANGISFTVQTLTANPINSSATKLFLNDVDVSSSLAPLPANGTSASFTTAPGTLASNTVYRARIEVQDVAGNLKSTNTFWFDTYSDAYLRSGAVKVIEAEEYNYTNGLFQPDPIPVSGFVVASATKVNGDGVGYLDLKGTTGPSSSESVDYYDLRATPEGPWNIEFRIDDTVGLSQGMYPELQDANNLANPATRFSDNVRSQYAAANLLEFVVHRTEVGEWLNYTRNFEAGRYLAYLRVASFGSTSVELGKVTSNPAVANQTTSLLGTFNIPNNMTRYNYRYIPALDGAGQPAVLDLSGTNTLRLTMAGTVGQDTRKVAINYLMLVPVSSSVSLFASATVSGAYTAAAGATVNTTTKTITIPMSGDAQFYRIQSGTPVTITNVTRSGNNIVITYN